MDVNKIRFKILEKLAVQIFDEEVNALKMFVKHKHNAFWCNSTLKCIGGSPGLCVKTLVL